jgi:hypothetical protein
VTAPIHIDVIGVGASPYDFLRSNSLQVIGVQVSEKAVATDQSGLLKFSNLRSQLHWQFREDLDPANNRGIALPPDSKLRADLLSIKWEARGKVIHVEDRDSIIKRIGRSADWASAYILARMDTPREADYAAMRGTHQSRATGHDPYANMQ